jgi:hypothetical protein
VTGFDRALYTGSASDFSLARLDAVGRAGIRNPAIDGDLPDQVTPAYAIKIDLSPRALGGVNLPRDQLRVIAVRGDIRLGSVQAAGLHGLAFSWSTDPRGHDQSPSPLVTGCHPTRPTSSSSNTRQSSERIAFIRTRSIATPPRG